MLVLKCVPCGGWAERTVTTHVLVILQGNLWVEAGFLLRKFKKNPNLTNAEGHKWNFKATVKYLH